MMDTSEKFTSEAMRRRYNEARNRLWGKNVTTPETPIVSRPASPPPKQDKTQRPPKGASRNEFKVHYSVLAKIATPPPIPEVVFMPPNVFDETLVYVCKRHKVAPGEVMARNRRREIVAARNELFWLLQRQGWSMSKIGRRMNRDHTSVLHGINRHIAIAGTYPDPSADTEKEATK